MCWGVGITAGMIAAGVGAAAITHRRGAPWPVPLTLGFFAAMEAIQLAGYGVIDQCGTPANRAVTLSAVAHIALQPIVINLFAMALLLPALPARSRRRIIAAATVASAVIVLQLLPIGSFGRCAEGVALCAEALCTRTGTWHQAWDVPYNGLLVPLEAALGTRTGFPSYMIAVFLLPALYGAWRFAALNFVAGPVLSFAMTTDPNEGPAIWCLFSIPIIALALSTRARRPFMVGAPKRG